MSNFLPPLLQRLANRPGGLGRAFVHKTAAGTPCLALVSKASKAEGVDPKKMCATFVVTSDDPDRVDDVVMSKGIVLANFKTNPIGLYGHGQMILPIGKWEDPSGKLCVWPRDKQTTGTLYFSQKTEHAAQVFALVEEGILRACSIGFNPLEEPESRGRGFKFQKTDLLEISVVAIPAQPTATLVRQVLSRGTLAGSKICEPVRKGLVPLCEAKPAWSNGASLGGCKCEGNDMSKKWRKAAPTKTTTAITPAPPKSLPEGTLQKLLDLIPPESKSALQECVSQKIPKLRDEGYPEDQAVAIAYSMCGEDKDMAGSNGTAGGYTVPEGEEGEKQLTRLEALVGKVLDATARVKAEPPPPHKEPKHPNSGPAAGEMPDQQQEDDGPPEPGEGRADPKDVLGRLVDALTDYIDLTTKPAPTQAAPGHEEPDGDEEEPDEDDMDLDGSQEEEDEETGMERYQFRTSKPKKTKGMKLCKACMAKMCKECKQMVGEDEDTGTGADEGAEQPDAAPEMTKKGIEIEEGYIDEQAILAALRPVHERAVAVGNAWQAMQGTMP